MSEDHGPGEAAVPDTVAASGTSAGLDRVIARNTVFVLLGRLVYVVGWLLVAPYMIGRLGLDRFGLWSLISVLSGLYLTFDLGLQSALTKFVAEFRAVGDRAGLRGIFTVGVLLYGALSLLFLALVVLLRGPLMDFFHVAPALRREAAAAVVGAAVAYGVMNFNLMFAAILGGLQRLDVWNRISIGTTLLQLLGVWVVLAAGGGLVALIVNNAVSLLIGIALGWWWMRRLAPEIGFDPSSRATGLLLRLTRYSVALQIIGLGGLAQFQLDKVLYGRFLSLATVGNYELGLRVTMALWSLPSLLLPALLPAVAHLEASGERERVVRLYRRASRLVLAVAFPLAAAIAVLAAPLFTAWMGPGHGQAALATTALGLLMGVNILTGVSSSVIRGVGRPGLEAEYHVIATTLHLVLSLALIPRIGFVGGLWGLVLSGWVGSLYFLWRFHRHLREPLGGFVVRVLARPLGVAVAAGVAARFVVARGGGDIAQLTRVQGLERLVAGGVVFAVVAVAGLLLTRAVSLDEVRELARLALGRARGTTAEAGA